MAVIFSMFMRHTLKGAAGAIGAARLRRKASTLEAALRTENGDRSEAIDDTIGILRETLAQLHLYLPHEDNAAPTKPLNEDAAVKMLQNTEAVLKRNWIVQDQDIENLIEVLEEKTNKISAVKL